MSALLAGLTTRGRCLLAGGGATAACAVVLDERDLLRIGAFVAMLPLLALLLAAYTRRTVQAERSLSPGRLNVHADVEVRLALRGGPLFGVLRLVDAVPDAAGPQPSAPPRFTVHRLPGRSGAVLTYPLRPVLRGVHQVGPLLAGVTDPLGLAEFERELSGSDRLVVLPRVVALRGELPALGTAVGNPGAALAQPGRGAPDMVIRPYRQGDVLRRVHWRGTARHGELMVRLEERPWHGGTTVLLDRRDIAHRGHGPDSSLEFAVSLTASLCAHLIAHTQPVTLVTEDGSVLSGPAGIDPLLDALAALRPSARRDLAGPALRSDSDVVAVLGALGPDQVDELLARRTAGGRAVLLDVASWDRAGSTARPESHPGGVAGVAVALRRAGWQVAVAGAGATPDRVWDDLSSAAVAGGVMRGT